MPLNASRGGLALASLRRGLGRGAGAASEAAAHAGLLPRPPALVWAVIMSSLSGDITVPGRPAVSEISAGVYAYVQPDGTWWINNTGFLVGPQGVISIDACATERRTRAYRDAIAAVTAMPVRAVVNTHHHGDHTFGNCLFPGAAIIAQERARAEAIAFGPPRDMP